MHIFDDDDDDDEKENPMNGKYRFVPDVAEHDLYM